MMELDEAVLRCVALSWDVLVLSDGARKAVTVPTAPSLPHYLNEGFEKLGWIYKRGKSHSWRFLSSLILINIFYFQSSSLNTFLTTPHTTF